MPSHTESVYCCRFRRLFSHYLRGEIRIADRHRQLFNLRRFNLLLYLSSTLLHSIQHKKRKTFLRLWIIPRYTY